MAKAKTAKAVKAAKVPETVYISEADQYLFAQGTHYDIYKKAGRTSVCRRREERNELCRLGTARSQRFCDWNV